MVKENELVEIKVNQLISHSKELILFNDDVNEFSYVAESLVEVCEIEAVQAEQITLIAHMKGKCGIISGNLDDLKPMYNKLTSRGLTVSIE